MKTSATLGLGSTLLLLVLVVPAFGASQNQRDRDVTHTCSAIQVSSPDATPARGHQSRRPQSFSASQILDLELRVDLSPALQGDHQVELSVYTPKGHLYQTISARVSSPETNNERGNAHGRRQALRATATLPVAGTSIVASSLYGEWRVEAHLDGAERACSRSQKFVIEP